MLSTAGTIPTRIPLAVWLTAINPYLSELTFEWAVRDYVPGQPDGVDLAKPVWIVRSVECPPRTLVDVLVIKEHHDAVGHRRLPMNNPHQCEPWPGRWGRVISL